MSNSGTQQTQPHPGRKIDSPDASRWYVVKTKPREESLCVEQLTQKEIPVFCPMIKEYRWRRRQTETVPLFPGYIFSRFVYPDQYYDVKWARGVNQLVRFGEDTPPAVDDSVIEFFRARINSQGIIDRTPEFNPGDPVRFRTGPLKDLMGTILKTDKAQERVTVLMELLYQAKIEVDSCLVEPIN